MASSLESVKATVQGQVLAKYPNVAHKADRGLLSARVCPA